MEVGHELSAEEATERLKEFVERLRLRHAEEVRDLDASWVDRTLHVAFAAMGFHIEGTLTVEQRQVRVDGKIPLAAMLLKGKIEKTIREELQRVLAPV